MNHVVDVDQELSALDAAPLGEGSVPGEVRLVPWGEVASTHGRFVVDEESGELVVKSFESHQCDLPIDYEHQTLGGSYSSPSGQAPAAGWIQELGSARARASSPA